jgi:hypothetical protein
MDKGSRLRSGTQNWSYVFKVRPLSYRQQKFNNGDDPALPRPRIGSCVYRRYIRVHMYQVSLDLT